MGAHVSRQDLGFGVAAEGGFEDLRQQAADSAADGMRIEIRSERNPLRPELGCKLFDEVEVVTETRIEVDIRASPH
ncbi:MAG: hypothetical protein WAR81_15185 [Pseudomonadales bacterium]|jgi:hypothetical protein